MPRKKDPAKATTTPRQKTLLYKRATYKIEPFEQTLEQLLNHAWDNTPKAELRRQFLDDDKRTSLVTSYRTKVHNMTFFEVLLFTPGMKALAADIDFEKSTIDPEQVDVKNEAGKKLELIEHMLHLGVSENHAIILQSGTIDSALLERHLNWLLSAAKLDLLAGQNVRLSNRLPPGVEDAIKSAKSINFDTEIGMTAVDKNGTGEKFIRPFGKQWDGLKHFLTGISAEMADVATELETQGLTETTPVDVSIRLAWHRKKRDSAHAMLDRVATGLRHVNDEIDYTIETKNGPLTKNDFILRRKRTIHCSGERPVRNFLHDTIFGWLTELHKTNAI